MSYKTRTAVQTPVSVAASTTAEVCRFPIYNALNLRIDVYTGKVGGTGDLKLQDQSAFGVWNDVKTVTLAASTDTTCTFDADTDEVTATSHGFSDEQAVVFNTDGELPSPLEVGGIYYVRYVDANTFKVKAAPDTSITIDLAGGSGTHTVTALGVASITLQAAVAADQANLPVRPVGRIQAAMGLAETVQVCAVKVCEQV